MAEPQGGMVKIRGLAYALARTKGVPMYEAVSLPFFPPQISQADTTEAQFPPGARATYSFRDFSLGYGLSETPIQGQSQALQYLGDAEGEGVDCSLSPDGPVLLGPALSAAIASTPGTFFGGIQSGRLAAYFTYNTGVYLWQAFVATAQVGTLAAAASDRLVAYRGANGQVVWYVPEGFSTAPQYTTDSGATINTITGDLAGGVQSFAVVDGDCFVAMAGTQGNARIARFNNGGSAPAIFGVIDPIGDPNNQIDRLLNWNGRLAILKGNEGVFVLARDKTTLAQNLTPDLDQRGGLLYSNGACLWRGVLIVPTGNTLLAFSADGSSVDITPGVASLGGLPAMTSIGGVGGGYGIRGYVAMVGGDAHNLYALLSLYPDSATGFLLKGTVRFFYGRVAGVTWWPILQVQSVSGVGSMQCFSARPATSGAGNIAATNSLLFNYSRVSAGAFVQVGVDYVRLPSRGRDPRQDTYYQYASGGTLYLPRLTCRFPAVTKTYLQITPLCRDLGFKLDGTTGTTAQSVQTRYKLDTTTGYTNNAAQTSGVGSGDTLGSSSGVSGRSLDVAMRLATTDATTSPQLVATTVDYVLQPLPIWQHSMTLDLTAGAVEPGGARPGAAAPQPPDAALRTLRTLPGTAPFTFVDPHNNNYTVVCPPDGLKAKAGAPPEGGFSGMLPLFMDVVLVETAPATASRTITYGQLAAGGTYGQLTGQTYAGLTSS